MTKLFDLKRWLTLDDAAQYITIKTNQAATAQDVLQLCLDGALTLHCFMRMRPAKRIYPYCPLIYMSDPGMARTAQELFPNKELPKIIGMGGDHFHSEDEIHHLEGPHEVLLFGIVGDYLFELITGSKSELITLEGWQVRDDAGNTYQIQESMYVPDVKLKDTEPDHPVGCVSQEQGDWTYIPCGEMPNPAELVVIPSAIDSLIEQPQNVPTEERSEINQLKTIGLLARAMASMGGSRFGREGKPNVLQIAEHLERVLPNDVTGLSNTSLRTRISKGLQLLNDSE